jgi:hypothetical protein
LETKKNVDSFFKQDLIKVKVIFLITRIKYGKYGEKVIGKLQSKPFIRLHLNNLMNFLLRIHVG